MNVSDQAIEYAREKGLAAARRQFKGGPRIESRLNDYARTRREPKNCTECGQPISQNKHTS